MGWASRTNHGSLESLKRRSRKKTSAIQPTAKVHIPNSDLSVGDALFMGMLKGLRPMSTSERQEAIEQGMDMRPPDIVEKEKRMKELSLEPETQIEAKIILTDS
jgi:hypothetical protein